MSPIDRLDAQRVHAALAGPNPPVLLDVREPWERATASIEPSIAIPLGSLGARHGELDRDTPLVIYCHHGMRSLRACMFLEQQGFMRLANLEGGIDAWSASVDRNVPRY